MRISPNKIDRYVLAAAIIYATMATVWMAFNRFLGDGYVLLYLLNTAYLYLFIPVPFLIVAALIRRNRTLRWVTVYLAALFLFHFGSSIVPRYAKDSVGPEITVMTYNIEKNRFPGKDALVLRSIRSSNADIVAVQELNMSMSRVIKEQLALEYPYQFLFPGKNAEGMGLISRYPMEKSRLNLPGSWFRAIQAADVTFGGRTVTLINIHFNRFYPGKPFDSFINLQRRHAETVARFSSASRYPVLLLGDLNATPAHEAYRTIARVFEDSWNEAGWGFGHTFPGKAKDRKLWVTVSGVSTPDWLVRIDYIFHSDEWITRDIRIGDWNRGSDHRPVVARLSLCAEAGSTGRKEH